ncbi:hypothetical protein [uncultured Phocaeicola sp.]|jgi:hypothetical protein|nr:hypothetical protein [uncultured Phocaeicola sp.]
MYLCRFAGGSVSSLVERGGQTAIPTNEMLAAALFKFRFNEREV